MAYGALWIPQPTIANMLRSAGYKTLVAANGSLMWRAAIHALGFD